MKTIDRRTFVAGSAAVAGLGLAGAARAQAPQKLRFSAAFT